MYLRIQLYQAHYSKNCQDSYFFNYWSRDPEILKRSGWGLYVSHHGQLEKKILGFRWSKKAEITLQTIISWQNISISIFKFSQFLLIKSYQFFKIYKRFHKEREKTPIQQSMRKEKLRKVRLCFITGCFINPFKMIINHFFNFSSSFAVQFQLFDVRDIKRANWEQQITRNGKLNIFFKNNTNLLVMNVTQLNFLN